MHRTAAILKSLHPGICQDLNDASAHVFAFDARNQSPRFPAIDYVTRASCLKRRDTRLKLRNHAASSYAVGDEIGRLPTGHTRNQAVVYVEHARNIGLEDDLGR